MPSNRNSCIICKNWGLMICRDEHGIIVQQPEMDGGDSAFTTGIMAFSDSVADMFLSHKFIVGGQLVRHPYQTTNTGTAPHNDPKSVSRKIKKGEFKIQDEKESVKMLDQVTDMLHVLPRMNRFENSYSCYEYVKFVKSTKDYDHNRFIKNLTKHKKEFVLLKSYIIYSYENYLSFYCSDSVPSH